MGKRVVAPSELFIYTLKEGSGSESEIEGFGAPFVKEGVAVCEAVTSGSCEWI